jgi:hypothetical protein
MSEALRPGIATLKVRVSAVVVCVAEPLALTLENVTDGAFTVTAHFVV